MKPRLFAVACICLSLSSCRSELYYETKDYLWYIIAGIIALFVIIRWTRSEPEKELDAIHAHRYHHFTDFQLAAEDFYKTVSDIITDRQFPNVTTTIVSLSTGGYFDPKRKYLEVKGDEQVFYVCAAPFGKNFFISYWLRDIPDGCEVVFLRKVFGSRPPRKTFYEADSEAMFMESVKAAVMQAIEKVTTERGLRKLSPDELIPKLS